MKHEEYLKLRNELIAAAEAALEASDSEAYEAKTTEVKELDAKWEQTAQRQAEVTALKGAAKAPAQLSPQSEALAVGVADDADMEYRKSFMNYVMKGIPMKNEGTPTTAGDVGPVIPKTVINRIIELMESNGNLLARVTRTHYKGGVSIPISAAKPTAIWTTERGDAGTFTKAISGTVEFSYYKLKVKVGVSIVVDTVTMEIFERTLANNVAEAMTRALESAIVNGSGSGQPKGLLLYDAPEGQTVDIVGDASYANLLSIEAALPTAYEAGAVYLMHKKIFFTKILAITDDSGQPVARVDAGIDGKPSYKLFGREVVLSDHMPASVGASAAKTIALLDLSNYMINTNLDVTVTRYEDHDTDDQMTKAIMLADGKLIDNNGLVWVTLKNA